MGQLQVSPRNPLAVGVSAGPPWSVLPMKRQMVRLLLVEDDADDARLVLDDLMVSDVYRFSTEWVINQAAALEALERGRFDVVLTDLHLPDAQGLEGIFTLRSRHPEVPIVVLSGNEDAATALLTMQTGAQDYLVKGEAGRQAITRLIAFAMERHRIESQLVHRSNELEGFTYAVTHDLRTPLISIDFLVEETRELLNGRAVPAEVYGHLDAVSRRITGMESLIGNLLALARASEGPQDQVVHLEPLVESVLSDLEGTIRGRGIDVHIDLTEAVPIRGNDAQVRQLLANLVGNAIKYTRDNGGSVTIRTRRLFDGHAFSGLRLEVEDNGPGIPVADRERIFKAFERIPDPLGRSISGSGIGLALVSKVAHKLGSWVHVRDGSEGGALFYLDIPPARLVFHADERGEATAEARDHGSASLGSHA